MKFLSRAVLPLLLLEMLAGCRGSQQTPAVPAPTGSDVSSNSGWQSTFRLSSGERPALKAFGNETSLAVDSGGTVHVVWYEQGENCRIYYNRSADNGATWGEPTLLATTPRLAPEYVETGSNPSVAVTGPLVHVFWRDNRDGNGEIYYKQSQDGGLTWGEDLRLTTAEEVSVQPSIAVSGTTLHLVWEDQRDLIPGPEFELYYKRSTDNGASWSDDFRLTTNGSPKGQPTVAAIGANVLVLWMDRRDGNFEIYFKRSGDGGLTWSPDTRLTDNQGISEVPAIAVNDDTFHLAWEDNTKGDGSEGTVDDYEIFYRQSRNGGVTWSKPARLTDAPKLSLDPSIAASGNNIHVVWKDRRDSTASDARTADAEVYYKESRDGGLTWSEDTRLTNDTDESTLVSVAASSSAIHVVWAALHDETSDIYTLRNILGDSEGSRCWRDGRRCDNLVVNGTVDPVPAGYTLEQAIEEGFQAVVGSWVYEESLGEDRTGDPSSASLRMTTDGRLDALNDEYEVDFHPKYQPGRYRFSFWTLQNATAAGWRIILKLRDWWDGEPIAAGAYRCYVVVKTMTSPEGWNDGDWHQSSWEFTVPLAEGEWDQLDPIDSCVDSNHNAIPPYDPTEIIPGGYAIEVFSIGLFGDDEILFDDFVIERVD